MTDNNHFKKNLSEPWFSLIQLNHKKCEGRLKKNDFAIMKKGDCITFENNELGFLRSFKVKITEINEFKNFKEYLEFEGLDKCLPGIDNIEDGQLIYYIYYSKEDEVKYGIVSLHMKVENN